MELHREEQLPPQEPWGRLLRLGAEEDEPQILLWKRQWTIGRKRGCDLSFPSNKLVSGDHCKLIVDEKSGHVILEDTSTNGTVINKMRLVKKQAYPLQSGDIIYLVYRKNEPEHTVAYLYESLKEKQSLTQEFFEANKGNMFHVTKDSSGRRQRDDRQVLPLSPMAQSCLEEPQPSTSTSDLFPLASTSSSEPELSSAGQKHSSGSDGELDLDLQLLVADQRGNAQTSQESGRVASVKPDKMGETLTCIICQDLLHDCVSLQPCMHTFCAACYSGWMYRSSLCPTCRCPVERICKNHILNNLVEAYLIQHPVSHILSTDSVLNTEGKQCSLFLAQSQVASWELHRPFVGKHHRHLPACQQQPRSICALFKEAMPYAPAASNLCLTVELNVSRDPVLPLNSVQCACSPSAICTGAALGLAALAAWLHSVNSILVTSAWMEC
nr:E3 ubiquitin-protein ligase CHFR-like isoform X2 [Meriones unguiculatus]